VEGYINDPHLDGSFCHQRRPEYARALLLDILALASPVGTTDLLSPPTISDLVKCTGARTTESQSHRQLASAIEPPGGFQERHRRGVNASTRSRLLRLTRFHGHDQDGQAVFEDARQRRLPR
jgi:3-deoxy-7-phosphoheptulonate synthase